MASAARKATRSSMGIFSLWLTDKGTFPVMVCAGVATIGAATSVTRFLTAHPDVCFSKERRESTMHYTPEEGSGWRARRFRFANYSRNPINQGRQYDSLYAKKENENVRR